MTKSRKLRDATNLSVLPFPCRRSNKLARLVFPSNIVISQDIGGGDHIVLLCEPATQLYAACRINIVRETACAPNYVFPDSAGMLCGRASAEALQDVLTWCDRATALTRYTNRCSLETMQAVTLPVGLRRVAA